MNLTDSFVLKCLCGSPIFIGEDVCALFPPTLRDIVAVGYEKFLMYLQILTEEKPPAPKDNKEMANFLEGLTSFQYFLLMTQLNEERNTIAKEAFRFFTHENVIFSLNPAGITIGPAEGQHIITEELFLDIQECLKKMNWMSTGGEDTTIRESDSPQVRALKMQMKKNHERLMKAKNKSSEKSDLSFSDLVASVAAGCCNLNISSIWDITYYAFHDQLKRMGWRERFDINTRARLAGAKLKQKDLAYWIKSINSKDK